MNDYELQLHIDDDVKPVTQRQRMVPLAQRDFVDEEVQSLLENNIIEEIDTPTTWLSPIHVVHKEGKQRLVIDMCVANEAISRVHRPIPVPDEVLVELNGAQFFSKVDLNSAYLQILLSENSRGITQRHNKINVLTRPTPGCVILGVFSV